MHNPKGKITLTKSQIDYIRSNGYKLNGATLNQTMGPHWKCIVYIKDVMRPMTMIKKDSYPFIYLNKKDINKLIRGIL